MLYPPRRIVVGASRYATPTRGPMLFASVFSRPAGKAPVYGPIPPATTDEAEKKRLGDLNAPMVKEAVMASRMNTWLSVPMLWGMIFGAHGDSFTTAQQWYFPVTVLAVVLLLMVMYSQTPKAKTA